MKLSWILSWARNGVERHAGLAPLAGNPATQAEVERLLTVFRTVHAGSASQMLDGLELRVLGALQAQSGHEGSAVGWPTIQSVCSRGWVPAAIAATFLCVCTGGFFVARETSLAVPVEREALTVSSLPAQRAPLPGSTPVRLANGGPDVATDSLATASARRKPAAPVSAGRRRGRASTLAAAGSR